MTAAAALPLLGAALSAVVGLAIGISWLKHFPPEGRKEKPRRRGSS